jgi:energy-coupling factor transport system permease protein
LLWAIPAMVPALVGRNPWPLAATLIAVLGVWGATSTGDAAVRWRPLLRLAMAFAVLSVMFNVLTAHVGDQVLGELPGAWPIVGGPLTLNALIYGLLSAVAILTLVVAGATIGANLDWSLTMRLLPERLAALSAAGSIAWTYLPRTVTALTEIREAQMARGFRPRGLRDALPLAVPLLAGGLERAMTTAEALEARAFGATFSPAAWLRPGQAVLLGMGLLTSVTGAFCLALNQLTAAVALLCLAAVTLASALRTDASARHALRRTRYRDPLWQRAEWIVSCASLVVLIVEIGALFLDPAAFRYEPYPSITAPGINLPLLASLALLLAPAAVRT